MYESTQAVMQEGGKKRRRFNASLEQTHNGIQATVDGAYGVELKRNKGHTTEGVAATDASSASNIDSSMASWQ